MAGSKTETTSSSLDTLKMIFALLIVSAGIVGFYYFSDQSNLYRVLGLLATVVVGLGLLSTTERGGSLLGFLKNSRTEVRKMVWPTRQETLQTTLIVMVLVLVVGIFLWLVDMFLGWGVSLVIGGA